MSEQNNIKQSDLPRIWERLSIYIAGILLAVCSYMFVEQKARIDNIEQRVMVLQVDKVSRQELNDLEARITSRMDSMKTDIIDRLDLYFGSSNSRVRK